MIEIYLAAALISLLATGAIRRRARRGGHPDLPGDPLELAYVNEGPRLVLFTALAELRRRGRAESAPAWQGGGIIGIDGPELPADDPPLLPAVLDALQHYGYVPALLDDERVALEVETIGIRLVLRGWYLSYRTQTRIKRFAPGWFVAVACVAESALTLAGGRPLQALALLGLGAFLAVATYIVVDLPPSTRAGRAALRTPHEKSLMFDIATGGEAAFWTDGARFADAAGASPAEMDPYPHLLTHRHSPQKGRFHPR